ncbi:hypothetical protein [Ralstonia pseudosolanacearum]
MMTEQHKDRLFSEIRSALANKGVLLSQEAIRIFFENTEPENSESYTLLMSYRSAKNHPDFAKIMEAQEGTFDFPGIVFSFTDETFCYDCSSDEMAEESNVWDLFISMLGTEDKPENVLKMKGLSLDWKWSQIVSKEKPSIKEAMNFIYQYDLLNEVFSTAAFRKHHGDLFIHNGYEKFNWVQGLIQFYLPDIEKIEISLKLKEDLNEGKDPAARIKI